jgi:hypothetical protein
VETTIKYKKVKDKRHRLRCIFFVRPAVEKGSFGETKTQTAINKK